MTTPAGLSLGPGPQRTMYLWDLLKRPLTDSDGEPIGPLSDVIVRWRGADLPLVTGLVAGVFFGLITSAIPYAMARGTRDFSSTMQLVAGRYDVLCDPQGAERGRDLLARLTI